MMKRNRNSLLISLFVFFSLTIFLPKEICIFEKNYIHINNLKVKINREHLDKKQLLAKLNKININNQKEREIAMSFNQDHLRELITEVLKDLEPAIPFSNSAVELLMLTCAQESHLGTWLRQINFKKGGLGIFQIEKATHNDMWDMDLDISNDNFLSYQKHLELLVNKYYNHNLSLEMNLKANIPYQIVISRLIYFRAKPPLPKEYDILELAKYYKKYFNTYKGKATVKDAMFNYNRFCI